MSQFRHTIFELFIYIVKIVIGITGSYNIWSSLILSQDHQVITKTFFRVNIELNSCSDRKMNLLGTLAYLRMIYFN